MDLDSPDEIPSCLPPWSTYILPARGKLVVLPLALLPLVEDHIAVVDHRHFVENIFRYAERLDSNLEDSNSDADEAMTQTDSDSSSTDSMDYDEVPPDAAAVEADSEDEDLQDTNFMPSPEWISSFVEHWASHALRSRALPHPCALAGLSPVPKILSVGHMRALGFDSIKWDEPRAFTDVTDRIGGFFISPPTQRTTWERTIIEASNEMHQARAHMTAADGDLLRSGVTYNTGFGRPCNIRNKAENQLNLALLRHSKAIQDITSFQNAMLQAIAPRLWDQGRETADKITTNDSGLHLPFRVAKDGPQQPTAFAEVEYCFCLEDSLPRKHDHISGWVSGWKALTSVGFYDSTEGQLILWDNKSLQPFPPGSTFFVPPGLLPFSFTAVSLGSQMFVMQSLHGDLEYFAANDCQPEPRRGSPIYRSAEERKADVLERAEVLLSKYPTIQEFDARRVKGRCLLDVTTTNKSSLPPNHAYANRRKRKPRHAQC
ncbi:hypothetical protein C8F04DRAFT_1178280 [Mycena alexandri]|uniref:Uncharacterized protein n=1 Tax=Mycena alexandri TaxID=1745969 RepID=A0AAD6T6W3_9AGAR|nr:hypothetical protein C8F04DRAFT_1178280 [Mycena alexandri]